MNTKCLEEIMKKNTTTRENNCVIFFVTDFYKTPIAINNSNNKI